MSKNPLDFKLKCLSIDLEVGIKDNQIHQFAAIRSDTQQVFTHQGHSIQTSLDQLDDFAKGVDFVLGHNILEFDLPHLRLNKPDLKLLNLPLMDTLKLNPLAFPQNPYHRLIKHYQDGQLLNDRINNPELDARIALTVFSDQQLSFQQLFQKNPQLLTAWHWLTTFQVHEKALDKLWCAIRNQTRPSEQGAFEAIAKELNDKVCGTFLQVILDQITEQPDAWSLAYAMAWISVAGSNSVMSPWVRHSHPKTMQIIKQLRDTDCGNEKCKWCASQHNPDTALKYWFGFDSFRAEPKDKHGNSLQRSIVHLSLQGEHVLGILPTGTGKSICYQIPALSKYKKTGALTLVISPLVALMADQVAGLEKNGITCSAALNGLLSMPERADVLEKVRMGDIGILMISPEQLRSKTCRKVLAQREIGYWVLDEAHCISKWGHDFRPDYRYVGRFIKESIHTGEIAPVLCLTATAKPEVVQDIVSFFQLKVGIELKTLDGGSSRTNLIFDVIETTTSEKYAHILNIIKSELPDKQAGGAIVYCASRKKTEEVSRFLLAHEIAADYFHAKLTPESKKLVQQQFINGELQVIVATNAFGMGIDKSDVRIVIHADIPGSLENYLQEAGRAGRDRALSKCILLYDSDDVENQFGMTARSRLSKHEIDAILKSLRRLDRNKQSKGEIVATAGEILGTEESENFERDSYTDDTRVRTALLWLEEADLIKRNENFVQIFPSSLRVRTLDDAVKRLEMSHINPDYKDKLVELIKHLLNANPDQGISTDEISASTGLTNDRVRKALYDLEQLGIASNDTALTVYLHIAVPYSSSQRLEQCIYLEKDLIEHMRYLGKNLGKGDSSSLFLNRITQKLKDIGHQEVLPEKVMRLIKGISRDGYSQDGGRGSINYQVLNAEMIRIGLNRDWQPIVHTAELRRDCAAVLLKHLLLQANRGARGNDILVTTTYGKLFEAVNQDLTITNRMKDIQKLIDHALIWLHEQEILRLNKGLAVFRPAMTINLSAQKRGFLKADFRALESHYAEQVLQIHVMSEYALRGLQKMPHAIELAMDYFRLSQNEFVDKWLADKRKELTIQTTPGSMIQIVDSLNNSVQQTIVSDESENTNTLVLAGPGSGKTRMLVHRIAYLIRVLRENPKSIIALSYNRHAAMEIRKRLHELIGKDARGVMIMTCHALAMRLVGASLYERTNDNNEVFTEIIREAISVLKGEGFTPDEADWQRTKMLSGFRWILVDEYQDIAAEQYDLIAALAGRTLDKSEGRLNIFAVGDDDQNIYAFNGASIQYIRQFEEDYQAKISYLVENYRSTHNIISSANRLIEDAQFRMKSKHPIIVDQFRKDSTKGGKWQQLDPVNQGKVAILSVDELLHHQAIIAVNELQRLAQLDDNWNWNEVAIIAREWKFLEPVRSYCESKYLPVYMADKNPLPFWQLREVQQLYQWLNNLSEESIDAEAIKQWISANISEPWNTHLRYATQCYQEETLLKKIFIRHFTEWLIDWGRESQRQQKGILLSTAHRVKGLEFKHVVVLDGGWDNRVEDDDPDASRRLYYVAMTRAKENLILLRQVNHHPLIAKFNNNDAMICRQTAVKISEDSGKTNRLYISLALKDVDIGYASRFIAENPIHQYIKDLKPGSDIALNLKKKPLSLLDENGHFVGKLAKSFQLPGNATFLSGHVKAIIKRTKDASNDTYQAQCQVDSWEVVLAELIFERNS